MVDLKGIELSESNLFLAYQSDTVSVIDLNRVSRESMLKIERIVSELKNA